MSRTTDPYVFVSANADEIIARMTELWESLSGRTVMAGSPEKLFIQWAANNELVIRNLINYIGNQNIPSRAVGENLDALGEIYYQIKRPAAKPAYTTLRFTISEAQAGNITIPAGTRVSTSSGSPVFETTDDIIIAAGSTAAEGDAVSQGSGDAYNGYAAGQLNTLIDLFSYYESVTNTVVTSGGADELTDDEYYDLMVASMDGHSTAGATESYKYFAKAVSADIVDVLVNSPAAGTVDIYALMSSGIPAPSAIKALILQSASSEDARPLTDYVRVRDPETVTFNVTCTYYLYEDAADSAESIESAVNTAVQEYIAWQQGKIGRDITPDQLIAKMMGAGVKRIEITEPVYTVLRDGTVEDPEEAEEEDYLPQLAQVGMVTVTNGGYESE